MKKLFVLVIAALSAISLSAQVKYHPELNLSPGIFFHKDGRVEISTIQGVKIGDYVSVGAGVGFLYDVYFGGSGMNNGLSNLAFPVFGNVKGYLPWGEKKAAFASASVGCNFGPYQTLFVKPGIGARFNKFKVEIDYCYEPKYHGEPYANNGIMLVLGWMFK